MARSNVTSAKRSGGSGSRAWLSLYIYLVRTFSGAGGSYRRTHVATATERRPWPSFRKATTLAMVPHRRFRVNSVSRRRSRSSTINPSAVAHRR